MKVVLFCGGLGMRLRDYSGNVPKPMVLIGNRPILWYLMKYYAHFGHRDFILCLGYGAPAIKRYFLDYEEYTSNDFVLSDGGRTRKLLSEDIGDWTITFVDTGLNANIGERLLAVRRHLRDEEMFLANYADGLSNVPLPRQLEDFTCSGATASFVSVKPNLSYHIIDSDGSGRVRALRDIKESGIRVNGGFFIFRQGVFDYIEPGDDLVPRPFERMIQAGELHTFQHDGYWQAVDTAKDKDRVDRLHAEGDPPWEVWNHEPRSAVAR